jgi:hypothetical protein
MPLSFFPGVEYRPVYMQEVFELVYHGNGGFSWQDVWNMPIPYRQYSLKKINEFLEKIKAEKNEERNIITESTDMSKFKMPPEVQKAITKTPDFVSKSKK